MVNTYTIPVFLLRPQGLGTTLEREELSVVTTEDFLPARTASRFMDLC